MSDSVIKIENLSKLYRLGEIGTGTISHDINRWVAKLRGKEDPFAKVGHVNDRTQKAEKGETVWALKDINLDIKEGEVLGIIGKNGAGKSTLLKILSRVTSPTSGSIKVKGRMASLLEVGTGFHPEMTGRENIYMNGTIMGMRKWEIDKKLDEIVDFAGVAKYIDTPVKRYSSGMSVRLGFAVAAHLEPEILVVDEVLAVGDAEFQKKAIGKMQEVSHNQGRTVLFVSHNMGAIKNLCKSCALFEKGQLTELGQTDEIIDKYLVNNNEKVSNSSKYDFTNRKNELFNNQIFIKNLSINNHLGTNTNQLQMGQKAIFNIQIENMKNFDKSHLGLIFKDKYGQWITSFTTAMKLVIEEGNRNNLELASLMIDKIPFSKGEVFIDISLYEPSIGRLDYIENAGKISIIEDDIYSNGFLFTNYFGMVFMDGVWNLKNVSHATDNC